MSNIETNDCRVPRNKISDKIKTVDSVIEDKEQTTNGVHTVLLRILILGLGRDSDRNVKFLLTKERDIFYKGQIDFQTMKVLFLMSLLFFRYELIKPIKDLHREKERKTKGSERGTKRKNQKPEQRKNQNGW